MALRFGLVGTGPWARDTHGAGLRAGAGGTLAGVWGRAPERAAAVAGALDVPAYESYDALLADVDAVVFSVPPTVQPDLAVRAARAGRHLLLEKPIAVDPAQAAQVREAVRASGVASLVFFTSRFRPEQREWIDAAARTGGWHTASAVWLAALYDPAGPFASGDWRQTEGALWDIGPHALSVLAPLLGPVERVTALAGRGDTVHLTTQHANGATGTAALSLTVPPAARQVLATAYGDSGVHSMPQGFTPASVASAAAIDTLAALVTDGRRDHPCDVDFGYEVVRVLDAARRSLAQKRAVEVAGVDKP
ncbi:Gfo/Idh/MocA family protein [Streptomyces zagrosensis]|uniref:Putative dehydrogenase n=1 Tax=Streptomyces zagrosensis TaxID=1042984 RepID=A0A7W9QGF3_9ACTN|nr:Gfo/Idh/MocA family oxidoreductase [Streptomyces zagrosensis]MBB5939773.1 putative dehydrogenase [Streptomyces zagrosensis]